MAKVLREAGEFCWVNMITPEPADARDFFAKVLGWSYKEMPGVGHAVQVDGSDIGGIFDLNGPNTPPGTKPHIGVMVKVESADAAAEKAKSLGGTVGSVFDVFDQGRMSVLFDPNGAAIDVWEPRKHQGTDVDSRKPGAPSWFDTMTTDVDVAEPFYAELFGWTFERTPVANTTYTYFSHNGTRVAGMMPIGPEMGGMKPSWGSYYTVLDADLVLKTAVELGGKVCIPVLPIPNVGRFCGLLSPQGVFFYAVEYANEGA